MKGAIIGDIIGSRFEFNNTKTSKFDFFTKQNDFTDDTICTVAIMEALMTEERDYAKHLVEWCKRYPNPKGAYGVAFAHWIWSKDHLPYNSFGNGAAMRVSPVAWACKVASDVATEAIATANVSHNHPEGIKGAMATAYATFLLRTRKSKDILKPVERTFYNPNETYQQGVFDETCQGTVPVALRIMAWSTSFEDAMRRTMIWGGDSDTLGAIVGGMAEAYYGVPAYMWKKAEEYLPNEMKDVINKFYKIYVT